MLTPSRYDLKSTFDVEVGSETFSIHTSVFTQRSEFFRAARKPEWLAGDEKKPVDLKDEDPEVFNRYTNCVYFGPAALGHDADDIDYSTPDSIDYRCGVIDSLVRVYLLPDKLQNPATCNIAIDEILRWSYITRIVPSVKTVSYVYQHTPERSSLRVLMRNFWIYDMDLDDAPPLDELPFEAVRDIASEFFRVKYEEWHQTIGDTFYKNHKAAEDTCYYHQHDDKHPRCVPWPDSD